jgi:hypothetical protein
MCVVNINQLGKRISEAKNAIALIGKEDANLYTFSFHMVAEVA